MNIFTLLIFTELCICDIESIMGMKQANVSKHMMKLRKEHMVEIRKEAQWVYYRLSDEFKKNNQNLITYLKEQALRDSNFNHVLKSIKDNNHCKIENKE